MWSKLGKNAILQGCVDCYCLPCELLLRSEDEAERHCEKTLHQKNLEKCHYLEDHADDCIRKVAKGYYCGFCNIYLKTLNKIKLHVLDASHQFNKSDEARTPAKSTFLKRDNNAIIAFDDALVDDEAWNGLSGDACLVCDVEYEDVDIHRSEYEHILKLITSNIKFGGDNSISRQIDSHVYQCLTCNILVPSSSLAAHFNSKEHKDKHLDSRKLRRNMLVKETIENKENDLKAAKNKDENTNCPKETTKSDIIDSVQKFQKNNVLIDLVLEKAFCAKCSLPLVFTYDDIENHIVEHKDNKVKNGGEKYPMLVPQPDQSQNEVKSNTGTIPKIGVKENPKHKEENIKIFSETNSITYNGDFNKAYCRICNTKIPSSAICIKEHVSGKAHQKLAENEAKARKETITQYETVPFEKFASNMTQIDTEYFDLVVINKEIVIDSTSLMICVMTEKGMLCCGICNRSFFGPAPFNFHTSQNDSEHSDTIKSMPVVLLQDEFIREVNPGRFHCGFCNELVSTWEAMKAHLQLTTHKQHKLTAKRMLERIQDISERKQKEEFMRMMVMLSGFRRF